jgi:hypothetical protein
MQLRDRVATLASVVLAHRVEDVSLDLAADRECEDRAEQGNNSAEVHQSHRVTKRPWLLRILNDGRLTTDAAPGRIWLKRHSGPPIATTSCRKQVRTAADR